MRLINADALIKTIGSHCYPVRQENNSIEPGMTLVGILQAIQEQPTVEPKRKTGKWIDKSGGIEGAWNYCSICGEQAIDLYDFCPNCGADMRGAEK